ncbi:MAG: hypothetical protein WCV85_03260 [Patescibacteria group bacterium]|jgi:primosomal protein N'
MQPAFVQIIPLRRVPRQFGVLDYQLAADQPHLQPGDILQVPFGTQKMEGVVWALLTESKLQKVRTIPAQQPQKYFTPAQIEVLTQLHRASLAPLAAIARGMEPQTYPRVKQKKQTSKQVEPTIVLTRDLQARTKMLQEIVRRASAEKQGLTCVVVPTYTALAEWEKVAGSAAVILTAKQSHKEQVAALTKIAHTQLLLCLGTQLLLPFPGLHRLVLDQADDAAYGLYEQQPRFDVRCLAQIVVQVYGASLTVLARWHSPRLQTWIPARRTPVTLGTLAPVTIINRQLETLEDRRLPLSPTLLTNLHSQKVLWLVDTPDDARALWCAACGTPVRCPTCSNTLQVRSEGRELFCSKDRTRMAAPALCAACGSAHLTMQKKGTAAVRQQLRSVIPAEEFTEIVSKKPELPSATARHVLSTTIIQRFPELQFDAVVIPFLDYTITRGDDFAASERAMDILALARMHVAPGGKIFVQTFQPDASFFTHVQNPEAWAAHLTEERRELGYPPAGILVTLEQQSPTKATASLPDFPSFVRASSLSAHLTSLRVPRANYAELVPLLQTLSGQGWNIQVNPPRLPRLQA